MPNTYMNESGRAVSALASYYKIAPEQIMAVHDELDLPPGAVKLKKGGGTAGHNGLTDIAEQLGSRDFWRLRIPHSGGDQEAGRAERRSDSQGAQPGSADQVR